MQSLSHLRPLRGMYVEIDQPRQEELPLGQGNGVRVRGLGCFSLQVICVA
jgi:hypothetical protein